MKYLFVEYEKFDQHSSYCYIGTVYLTEFTLSTLNK